METIDEIVRELFDNAENFGQMSAMFKGLAERIEAANAEPLKKIQQLEEENTRLRSALKPVLDADTSVVLNFEETQIVTGHDVAISALYAIDEAKRIYNEKKEGARE